jgi:glycosyltransferase involved in cell wall biosynthesis
MSCRLLRIPCIPNVSGVGNASQLPGWKGYVYRFMSRVAFRKAAMIFFQNSTDQQAFSDSGILKSVPHECLPGSGVDLKRFRPTVRVAHGPVRFLLACRLIQQKGVVEYLKAAEALKNLYGSDVEFFLAGVPDNSARAVPEAEVMDFAERGIVDYLGNVPDISTVMADVDCAVLPSAYPEGVPRFLLEGAAAGKILVTTDRPGCRDTVINGVNGYFCEPQSVDSLIAVMEKVLLLSRENLRSMGLQSRKLAVASFNEQRVISAYLTTAERFAKN